MWSKNSASSESPGKFPISIVWPPADNLLRIAGSICSPSVIWALLIVSWRSARSIDWPMISWRSSWLIGCPLISWRSARFIGLPLTSLRSDRLIGCPLMSWKSVILMDLPLMSCTEATSADESAGSFHRFWPLDDLKKV